MPEVRDDQMALEEIRDSCRGRIVLMPRRFQRLRLDGEADGQKDAVVMHWTGAEGKRLIRERTRRDAGDARDTKEQREPNETERDMEHAG